MDPLYIEVVGSGGAPAELPRQGKLVIGSSSEKASFLVPGQGVADVHCAIGRIKGGGWALRDLGSEFGTMLNGEPVEATRLSEGDEILLGSKKLRIFSLASAKGPTSGNAPSSKRSTPREDPPREDPPEEMALEDIVLPETAPAPAPPAAAPSPRPAAKPRASSRPTSAGPPEITGYQVDRLLGRGAMGDVYLSTQESLDRRVALKVLKPKLAGDEVFVQRFKDEARAAARLNHPNIVTVFDVGQSGDHHFLSMEFMAGGSIEARLEELGPLPWREALDVLRDSAAGLVYAESRGIVHRDIKPENLMRNQDGVTKIADLGLAVQVEQETVDSSGGKIFGTPHFIAPEVAKGQPADARGDLYALGVTAYRVLSGKTPFEGATSRDILRAAMTEEPAQLGTLVPGLPARLQATIHRLLEKDPDRRPPSASILLKELEAIRSGDMGSASTPGAPASGGSKGGLIAGVAAVALAAAGYLFIGGGDDPAPAPEPFKKSGVTDPAETQAKSPAETPGETASAEAPVRPAENPAGGGSTNGADLDPAGSDEGSSTSGSAAGPSIKQSAPAAEAELEYQAERATLALNEELLTPADRAARLRILAEQFAGTDAAARAFEEAALIESGASAATDVAQARAAGIGAALGALTAAANFEATPFHPGQALRAMNLIIAPANLATDPEFLAGRAALVDRAMKSGLARGRAATAAADEAAARGDLPGTQAPLREFVGLADLPTGEEAPLLVGLGAPSSVKELEDLAAAVRERLNGLRGSEEAFAAIRTAKERAAIATLLGSGLESDLRQLAFAGARERLVQASGLCTDAGLAGKLRDMASSLEKGELAANSLLSGWATPGWRRRGVIDPRGSGNASVLGTAPGALMLEAAGGPESVPLSAWMTSPKALDNLFKGRLDRSWSEDEEEGIAVLMGLSASLQLVDTLTPALRKSGRRVTRGATTKALQSFSEVQEWVDRAPQSAPYASRQRAAARLLADAILARQDGDWSLCASLLGRLIDENRATWVVMLLSDGGVER